MFYFDVSCVFYTKKEPTGPTIHSLYPRRLKRLTICKCNYKGRTFSLVILRPRVLAGLGIEHSTKAVNDKYSSFPGGPGWDASPCRPPIAPPYFSNFFGCSDNCQYPFTLTEVKTGAVILETHGRGFSLLSMSLSVFF